MPLRGEINSAIPQIQEAVGTDAQGRPVSLNEQYRRFLETLWERSGGFEDETFANDAQISDLQSAIATAGERLEALEQSIQQDRAIDAALDDLQTRIAFIENLPTIQENADVAGQIDAIQFGLNSIEEQLFTAPRGIDIVTDAEVANNANISPSKIKVITEETETYTNTAATGSWLIIMKKQIGGAARANQFFLDGSRVVCVDENAASPGGTTGNVTYEVRIHETEPTVAADRTNGTQLETGIITVDAAGPTAGNVSFWTPSTQFYSWRDASVSYPTSSAWIVIWASITSGGATSAAFETTSGLGTRIEFTSAFGFGEL